MGKHLQLFQACTDKACFLLDKMVRVGLHHFCQRVKQVRPPCSAESSYVERSKLIEGMCVWLKTYVRPWGPQFLVCFSFCQYFFFWYPFLSHSHVSMSCICGCIAVFYAQENSRSFKVILTDSQLCVRICR